jgi:hypothetical protein
MRLNEKAMQQYSIQRQYRTEKCYNRNTMFRRKRRVLATAVLLSALLLSCVGCSATFLDQPAAEATSPPLLTPPADDLIPPPPEDSPPVEIQLVEPLTKVEKSDELIEKRFSWHYQDTEWTWHTHIPQSLYDYYQGLPRPATEDYSIYVTHPLDDDYLDRVTSELERVSQEAGFSYLEEVELTAACVQSLPYTTDSVTTPYDEYPRYPIETLVDEGGDCEDTSILLASLLQGMGHHVIIIVFPPQAGAEGGHCGVGISGGGGVTGSYIEYHGERYFYLESTNVGWTVGEMPEEYQAARAQILELKPTAIMTHQWNGQYDNAVLELEVTIENLGTADANDAYVLAGFEADGNKLWNTQESDDFDLSVGEKAVVNLTLSIPRDEHTRLVVQIVLDGYAVDESFSEWIDT